jgi:hypothetical protein
MAVTISSLTVNTNMLEGLTFQNCRIIGPAVLIPLGNTTISHCNFGGDINAIFWEIPLDRQHIVGAVGLLNCTLSACTFNEIGLAGPHQLRQALEQGAR